ncbi:MAG: carboxypeptidase regulatory-like domain-containing protein [Candidatus Krumholzibacteria bacterium]|nr:carboxypeptidase regulatory-like domain-containing protein [Candidatus Krumholzibacteria bacterium]
MNARSRSRLLASVLSLLIVLSFAHAAMAQTGRVAGRVTEAKTGSPLPYANVVLLVDGAATKMGGMTLTDGSFQIVGVPTGTYTVKVMMMGYKPQEKSGIRVDSGQTAKVDFALEEGIVGTTQEIVVEAEQVQIDVKSSDVSHSVSKDELEELPVDDVVEAIALKGGIVKTGDDLHVRGGRSGEVQFQIDGVPVDDPLGGGMISVGMLGTDDSQVITGGMDAEYGNAQSAIVNVSTREGGRTFEGQVRYMTDDFGRKDKTYTNYDRFSLGFGGPTPIRNLTFYVSGEFTSADGDNWAIWSRDDHLEGTWLDDFASFSQRQSESYNMQGKLAWQVKPGMKLVGEAIFSHARSQGYSHNWNIEGYAQKIYRFTTLRPSRESLADDARSFGPYVSVYHGPWIEKEVPRVPLYPGSLEQRRGVLYPITLYSKVRDPNNPEAGAFIVRYDHFYARLVENIYGEEVEIIWDEAIINEEGQVARYENKLLFEGYQNPDSKFSYFRDDSSYVAFNSAERTNVTNDDNFNIKFALNHNVNDNLLYTINISRSQFDRFTSVLDPVTGELKDPVEFLSAGQPVILPAGNYQFSGVSNTVWYTDPDYPYFVDCYDAPYYQDRQSVIYTVKADLTSQQWNGHRFKTGIQLIYNELDENSINYPGNVRLLEDGSYMQGRSANQFQNFNPEASYYVQDKWEYQGMVVNGGLRFDFFSPGNNTEIRISSSEIDPTVEKYKFQISPRLGFAFPITDKDKFHFHYGRFTQWPSRTYLFRTQDLVAGSGVLGNPDLDEELTVSYQAGVSHQFTETVAANFVVFNKDIYGLISSTRVTDEDLGIQGYRYINRTYASSRGVELAISKRLSHYIGGEISYTYSFADGVASDAEFGVTAEGLSHLPTQEMPLDWDQRHTLNVTVRLQDENNWGATVVYSFGSGLPWTPIDRFARRQDPLWENSRRLDHTHVINMQGRKKFNIYGQELTLFFEGRNLLDDDVLLPYGVAPGAWPGMVNARMDGGSYLTETGNFGGAYLQDLDEDGIDDFTPVNDPTIWASRRQWRIGFGFEV